MFPPQCTLFLEPLKKVNILQGYYSNKTTGKGSYEGLTGNCSPILLLLLFFDQLKIWKINFNIKKKSILPVKLTGREKRHNA